MAKAACSVEFPLYGVTVLEQDKIVLVGGGGSMKSGIPNMVEIYDFKNNQLTLSQRYDCGSRAPTCVAAHPGEQVIAVGLDHKVNVLQMGKRTQATAKTAVPSLKSVCEKDCIKVTDEEMVKAVTFCCYGDQLVTVGEDNSITIYEYPSMVRRWTINRHLAEVTQVTAHPGAQPHIVTATRRTECMVWDVESGQQIKKLEFTDGTTTKYRYRNIKYNGDGSELFAIMMPICWTKDSTCHIVKFCSDMWSVKKQTYLKGEPLAELAVCPNNDLFACASSNGHIYIYNAESMSLRRKLMDVHGLFVTGLTFIPHTKDNPKESDYSLVSISADHDCKLHDPHLADPKRLIILAICLCLMVALYYILWQFNIFPELTDQHYLTYFIDEPESGGGVKSEL